MNLVLDEQKRKKEKKKERKTKLKADGVPIHYVAEALHN